MGGIASANTTVNFSDFSNTSGLALNGFATPVADDGVGDKNVLQLTPTDASFVYGTAFSQASLQAASGFSTSFQWRINDPTGITDAAGQTGADGFVFTVQRQSSSAGGAGEGIGYQGITPSVGVKFDTFQNTDLNDPSSNYIGVATNGDINNADYPNGQTIVPTQFDNGSIWSGWVDYNGTSLSIYAVNADTTVKPATPLLTYDVDIPTTLGGSTAFVGFTSAGGEASENTYLLNWTYYDFYNPTGGTSPPPPTTSVPLPSAAPSGLMLLGGIGAVMYFWRRRTTA
jgi:hypothetical protein